MKTNEYEYPSTIFSTPASWGRYTVYGTSSGMELQIADLKDAGGEDWDGINISQCAEYELVAKASDGTAAYVRRHVRNSTDVYIVRSEGNGFFELVETLVSTNPQNAIRILATTKPGSDVRDAAVQALAEAAEEASEYGDPDSSLVDWIAAGEYTGSETVDRLAAEWDERDE